MKELVLLIILIINNLQADSLGYADMDKIANYPEDNFKLVAKDLANDRGFILSIIHHQKNCKYNYSDIKRCGNSILEYVAPKFKKDKEIVLEAFKEYRSLYYVDNSLKKDKNFILKLINSVSDSKKKGDKCNDIITILKFADQEIIDKELFESSLNICHYGIFNFMPKKLKSNKKYAKKILKKYPMALKVFDNSDKSLVSLAINSEKKNYEYSAFEYASENLKKDKDFVLKMMKINPLIFKYVSEDLRKEKKLALMAVKIKGSLLRDLDDNLKNDRELVSLAIKQNSQNIRYAGKDFIDLKNQKVLDKKILMILLKEDKKAYDIASDKLKKDKDVLKVKNEVDLSSCKNCHGDNFELIAMGTSKVVKNMSKAEIINALKGYKTGEYGGAMKTVMKINVEKLSNKDIENIASQIKE